MIDDLDYLEKVSEASSLVGAVNIAFGFGIANAIALSQQTGTIADVYIKATLYPDLSIANSATSSAYAFGTPFAYAASNSTSVAIAS